MAEQKVEPKIEKAEVTRMGAEEEEQKIPFSLNYLRGKITLVFGEAETGKTTLLAHLLGYLAKKEKKKVWYFHSDANLSEKQRAELEEALGNKFITYLHPDKIEATLSNAIKSGKYLAYVIDSLSGIADYYFEWGYPALQVTRKMSELTRRLCITMNKAIRQGDRGIYIIVTHSQPVISSTKEQMSYFGLPIRPAFSGVAKRKIHLEILHESDYEKFTWRIVAGRLDERLRKWRLKPFDPLLLLATREV